MSVIGGKPFIKETLMSLQVCSSMLRISAHLLELHKVAVSEEVLSCFGYLVCKRRKARMEE